MTGRDDREDVSRELRLKPRVDPMTKLGPVGFPIEDLHRVRLGARPGHEPSEKPPVRIFIGSEPAQYRPERVLVWSIEQVRDPSRIYEITLLRELPGFDRTGWTTSFTNYRFLIPHLTGALGRAIYNDEDQIYLSDPAELFDANMGDHGYLAVSPKDTSVMLVDCERMAPAWPMAACFRETKNQLQSRARAVPGLFGALGGEWNARDEEHRDGWTRCLHYTTLHTQPWRPFPERFVYYDHPQADLWFDLERGANAVGFQLSTRENPTPGYARTLAEQRGAVGSSMSASPEETGALPQVMEAELRRLVSRAGAHSLLEVVPGWPGGLEERGPRWGAERLDRIGLTKLVADDPEMHEADGVVCLGGLGEVPLEDLPWVVDELARHAKRFVLARVRAVPARPSVDRRGPPAGSVGMPEWWQVFFEHAVARHPELHWEIVCEGDPEFPAAPVSFRSGGAFLGSGLPEVWVLAGARIEDTQRALRLAGKLGWPAEQKSLTQPASLESPWPDLVIASGADGADAARRIRVRALGQTRAVQLGVEGADPIDTLDLSVVPGCARLLAHPRRTETAAPLARWSETELEQAAARWKHHVEDFPSPRLGVLLGGDATRHRLSRAGAGGLARGVKALAQARGMSILVLTAPGVTAGAVEAFRSHLGSGAFWLRTSDAREHPLPAILGLADVFVVTGEGIEHLSEACATGKPVFIHPVDKSRKPWAVALSDALSEAVVRRAQARPQNRRGTTRPQQRLEHFCARLLARGRVVPVPDLVALRDALIERGLAQDLGMNRPDRVVSQMDDAGVVDRIRSLLGVK